MSCILETDWDRRTVVFMNWQLSFAIPRGIFFYIYGIRCWVHWTTLVDHVHIIASGHQLLGSIN